MFVKFSHGKNMVGETMEVFKENLRKKILIYDDWMMELDGDCYVI